jgi:hypothetical protein
MGYGCQEKNKKRQPVFGYPLTYILIAFMTYGKNAPPLWQNPQWSFRRRRINLNQNVLAGNVLICHFFNGRKLTFEFVHPPVQIVRIHTLPYIAASLYR